MSEPFDPPPPPPPAEPFGPPPGGGEPPGNPWEQRAQLGFVQGLIENIKLFVTNPTEAFAQTKLTGDYASPLIFAILVGWVMFLVSQIWGLLFGASIMPMMPGEMREQMGPFFAASGAQTLIGIVLFPIFAVIGLFVWSGILHLCVMLVGGTENSRSGFEGTFRTVCYSYVASLAQIIPFVGGLIALVWTIFLGVVGLSTMHRTTQGKSLLAILIPLILCCICIGVMLAVGVGAIVGLANR